MLALPAPAGTAADAPITRLVAVPAAEPPILLVTAPAGDNPGSPFTVRRPSPAERVRWALGVGHYATALAVAAAAPQGSLRAAALSIEAVGDRFLEAVHAAGDWERLVSVLPHVIASTTVGGGSSPHDGDAPTTSAPSTSARTGDRGGLVSGAESGGGGATTAAAVRWSRWIDVFRSAGRLPALAPCIPVASPRLPTAVYDAVLVDLATSSPATLHDLLGRWPVQVYSLEPLTGVVEAALLHRATTDATAVGDDNDDDGGADHDDGDGYALRESLYHLYAVGGRHAETVALLLSERRHRVFDYIETHRLYDTVRSTGTLRALHDLDAPRTTGLLVRAAADGRANLPADVVVPLLQRLGRPRWLLAYLHALSREPGAGGGGPDGGAAAYTDLLISLYASLPDDAPPGALLRLLRTSPHYSLDAALHTLTSAARVQHAAATAAARERRRRAQLRGTAGGGGGAGGGAGHGSSVGAGAGGDRRRRGRASVRNGDGGALAGGADPPDSSTGNSSDGGGSSGGSSGGENRNGSGGGGGGSGGGGGGGRDSHDGGGGGGGRGRGGGERGGGGGGSGCGGILGRERVTVLAAMGDLHSALSVLLDELNDVAAATAFVADHAGEEAGASPVATVAAAAAASGRRRGVSGVGGDGIGGPTLATASAAVSTSLRERLLRRAAVDPAMLAALLDAPAAARVDAVRLVALLGPGTAPVAGLRDRLHRLLVDASLERALREGCAASMRADAEALMGRLEAALRAPLP